MMPRFKDAKVTFGIGKKYRNHPIEEVPDDYLEYVLGTWKDLNKDSRKEIKKEIMRRTRAGIVVEDENDNSMRGRLLRGEDMDTESGGY